MNKAQEAVRKAAEAIKGGVDSNQLATLLEETAKALRTEPQQTIDLSAKPEAKRQSLDKYRKAGQKAMAQEIENSMTAAGYAKFQGNLEEGDSKWFLKKKNSQVIHIKDNQFSVKNGEHVVQPTTNIAHIHKFLKQ